MRRYADQDGEHRRDTEAQREAEMHGGSGRGRVQPD